MLCVRCQTSLRTQLEWLPADRIEIDVCDKCGGTWFDRREIEISLGLKNPSAFAVDSPLLTGERQSFKCPRGCDALTLARHLAVGEGQGAIFDQCPICQGLWIDGGERDRIAAGVRDKRVHDFVDQDPERARLSTGYWLFMFFTGVPVEQWNPVRKRAVVTPALVALCVLAFVAQLASPDHLERIALVPSQLGLATLYTLLTHMFLHGGIVHVAGNMYFLWIFGDNVEDRLGRRNFLALYLVAGIVAALTHALATHEPTEPMVGASGAIAGVMAAYAVLFPRARLISLILFWRVRWRAWAYLGLWFAIQFLGVAIHETHIAWWAHIGGFAVGLAAAWPFRRRALVPALS